MGLHTHSARFLTLHSLGAFLDPRRSKLDLEPIPGRGFCGRRARLARGSPAEMADLMERVRAGRVPAIPVEARPLSEVNATLDDLRTGRIVGRVALQPDG